MSGSVPGPDGRLRCPWALSTPDYIAYHDQEWGRPVRSVDGPYERLTLEAFQSGLSWLTILRKRDNFRRAFAGFDPARVAAFTGADVERLLADKGIVRNRAKIEAAITNAVVTDRIGGQLSTWSGARTGPAAPAPPRWLTCPPRPRTR